MLSALQTDSSAAHASQIAGRVEGLRARMEAAVVQLLGRSFVVGGAGDDEDQAMVAFEFRCRLCGVAKSMMVGVISDDAVRSALYPARRSVWCHGGCPLPWRCVGCALDCAQPGAL